MMLPRALPIFVSLTVAAAFRVQPRMSLDATTQKGLVFSPGASGPDSQAVGMPVVHRYKRQDRPSGERWVMWYQARGEDMEADLVPLSTGRILRAESDDGIHWARVGETPTVLDRNEEEWWAFDSAHVGLGDVTMVANDDIGLRDLTESGGSTAYFMYTYGGDWGEGPSGVKGGKMKIGVAVSQDGTHWSRIEGDGPTGACLDEGPPGDWDSPYVGWPQVVPCVTSEKEFAMYYCSYDQVEKRHCMGLAVGGDGLKWEKKGKIFGGSLAAGGFDEKGVSRRHVIRDPRKGGYRMWYEGVNADGIHSIGYATSEDGVAWTAASSEAVLRPTSEADAWDAGGVSSPRIVAMDDGSLRMYYVGYGADAPGEISGPKKGAIGVAVNFSGDGLTWERV